jgi:hypothetical protein
MPLSVVIPGFVGLYIARLFPLTGQWHKRFKARFDSRPKKECMTPQPRTLSVSEEMRIFLGLLVQPFVAAGLTFVTHPLIDRSGRAIYGGGIDPDPMRSGIALALYVGIAAFFVTIAAAFPAAVWVLKRYPLTLWRTLLWGVLLGNILSVLGTMVAGSYGLAGLVRVVLFASFLGLGGATAFWAIWMLSRPKE